VELDMMMSKKTNIELLVQAKSETSLRELENLRKSLATSIISVETPDVQVYQEASSRTLDPDIVGAIGLAITPIVVEKVTGAIVQWLEKRNDCSVTLSVPVKGGEPIQITYNPKNTPKEKLDDWVKMAKKALK